MFDTMLDVEVMGKNAEIVGFHFKPGFAVLVDRFGKINAATSGRYENNFMFVYRLQFDGTWIGSWECEETFPIQEVLDAIEKFKEDLEIEKALNYSKNTKLHISEYDIEFTDVVPGRMCNDGGDYGFYTRYCPIPERPGIYRVYTKTTCDFDACGTGFEGIKALTTAEYRKLRRASNKIEEVGSLY